MSYGQVNKQNGDIIPYAGSAIKVFPNASQVLYDNTDSGMTATEVQSAIDELSSSKASKSEIYDLIYPIGSVYISITNTNPSTMFGGTWELMGDGYLRNNAQSASGGSLTSGSTVLTEENLPAHSHTATSSSAGGHTHTSTTQSTGSHSHTSTTGSYGNHTHTATTQNTGAHTHTLTSNSAGGHTHTATTNTTGDHKHSMGIRRSIEESTGNYGLAESNIFQGNIMISSGGNWNTGGNGNHSHTLTTNNQGAHSHTATTGSYGNHTHTLTTQNTGAHTHTLTTNSVGDHSHTLTTDNQGSHTHTLTTSSIGGGNGHTHSIEPTYIGIYAFKRVA